MDPSVLWTSHWLIVVHACTALAAIIIGSLQFALPKGTDSHRQFGYVWVTLLLIVCVSSFGIFDLQLVGPFSPIHILSLLTLYTVVTAVIAVRKGNIERHKRSMTLLYVYALLLTGAFTLFPGRVMNELVFG